MQVKLLLFTFYLNGRLHAVVIEKLSEQMLKFWTVWFFKNRIRTEFWFSANPYHVVKSALSCLETSRLKWWRVPWAVLRHLDTSGKKCLELSQGVSTQVVKRALSCLKTSVNVIEQLSVADWCWSNDWSVCSRYCSAIVCCSFMASNRAICWYNVGTIMLSLSTFTFRSATLSQNSACFCFHKRLLTGDDASWLSASWAALNSSRAFVISCLIKNNTYT